MGIAARWVVWVPLYDGDCGGRVAWVAPCLRDC